MSYLDDFGKVKLVYSGIFPQTLIKEIEQDSGEKFDRLFDRTFDYDFVEKSMTKLGLRVKLYKNV